MVNVRTQKKKEKRHILHTDPDTPAQKALDFSVSCSQAYHVCDVMTTIAAAHSSVYISDDVHGLILCNDFFDVISLLFLAGLPQRIPYY